jgi:uncharacterized protein YggE
VKKDRRRVTVSAVGKATAVPDELTVSLGVQVRGATAREALARANEQTRAAIDTFKAGGVDDRDLATANLTIWPEYGEGRRVDGYQSQNTLSVRLRDMDQAGRLLDTVAGVIGDDIIINGLSFAVSEPEPVLAEARGVAMAGARAKAEQLAEAAGARVGEVLTIDEDGGGGPVTPKLGRMGMAAAESVPIEAGERELTVAVTVTYRLTT